MMPDDTEEKNNGWAVRLPEDAASARLDKFLAGHLQHFGLSREKVKQAIANGRVSLNGRPCLSPKELVRPGDQAYLLSSPAATCLVPCPGELTVCYQDADLALIDKPADLLMHPCPSASTMTLAHRLLHYFPELSRIEGDRPGIVHRLDKDTTGLVLIALTERCRLALAEQFEQRKIVKEYLALVAGVPDPPQGLIQQPIGRHERHKVKMAVSPKGKPALSYYNLVYADPEGRFSLLQVRIVTGRTHQVRVHLQHLGHPLLGDFLYGAPKEPFVSAPRPMLHAWRLVFSHPFPPFAEGEALAAGGCLLRRRENEFSFVCPPPEDFQTFLFRRLPGFLPLVLTGSPGCGKSALLRAFGQLGLSVLSADELVADLYQPGRDAWILLKARFASRFIPDETLPVDKKKLAAAMMREPALRREVEALIHPLVFHAVEVFFARERLQGAALAVAELPLYFEAGHGSGPQVGTTGFTFNSAPWVIGVHASFDVRKHRLMTKRLWAEDLIDAVESWQMDEEQKMRLCNEVVDNDRDDPAGTGLLEAARAMVERLSGKLEHTRSRTMSGLRCIWTAFPD